MSGRKRTLAAGFALLTLTVACFYTSAPSGFLATAREAQHEAFGGWVRVDRHHDVRIEGELLAATTDTIHLHTSAGWTAVPASEVRKATLTAYKIPLSPTITWAVLGGLSTVSHGFFLILSAPIWTITGTSAAASASRAPRIVSVDPMLLRPYARFPQGLPAGLDRNAIRGKFGSP